MTKVDKKKAIDQSDTPLWASQDKELFTRLGTDLKQGLSVAEAATRLETFGPNAIVQDKQIPAWKIFLRQFKSPLRSPASTPSGRGRSCSPRWGSRSPA